MANKVEQLQKDNEYMQRRYDRAQKQTILPKCMQQEKIIKQKNKSNVIICRLSSSNR